MQSKIPVIPKFLDIKHLITAIHNLLSSLPEIVNFNQKKQESWNSLMKEVTVLLEVDKPDKEQLFSIMQQYVDLFVNITFVPDANLDSLYEIIKHGLDGYVLLSDWNEKEFEALVKHYEQLGSYNAVVVDKIITPLTSKDAAKLSQISDSINGAICNILRKSPEHFNSLFSQFIAHEKGFRLLIGSLYGLNKFLRSSGNFSKNYPSCIKILLTNPSQYQYLIKTFNNYLELRESIKEHGDIVDLIPSLFWDEAEFQRLIRHCEDFAAAIKMASPEEARSLMAILLSAPQYERLVPDIRTLLDFKRILSDEHAKELIDHNKFGSIQYQRLVTSIHAFLELANNSEDAFILVQNLMSNEDEFKRLIDITDVESLKTIYRNKHFLPFRKQLLEHFMVEGGCFAILKNLPQEQLLDFIKKLDQLYDALKSHLPVNHHSSIGFLQDKKEKIIALHAIFGKMTFDSLKSKLVSTPVPIEKYFNSFPLYNETEINLYSAVIQQFNSQISKREINQLAYYFARISQWDDQKKERLHTLLKTVKFEKPHQLLTSLYTHCLKEFLNDIGINAIELKEHDLKAIMEKLPVDKFLLLLHGFQLIEKPSSRTLMIETLKADLDNNCSFQHFAHSTTENTPLGSALAQHNMNCVASLKSKGIDTDLAFNYPYKKTISYGKDSKQAYFLQCEEFHLFLNALSEMVVNAKLNNAIKELQSQLSKGIKNDSSESSNKMMFERMHKEPYINLIKRIEKNLQFLIGDNSKTQKKENFTNLVTALEKLQGYITFFQKASQTLSTKNTSKKFYITQLNENNIDILFFGADVSCCLAPDGGSFSNLFMRRADRECFMIGIRNEMGEVICGNSLYFASDIDNPEDVYVVANFVELRVSYSLNPELRDFLFRSLCDFTKEFADKVKAKDFIIKIMDYGVFEKTVYLPEVSMCIQKNGGCFHPGTLITEEYNTKLALHSLDDEYFYQAQPVPLDYALTLERLDSPKMNAKLVQTLGLFNQNKKEDAAGAPEQGPSFQA